MSNFDISKFVSRGIIVVWFPFHRSQLHVTYGSKGGFQANKDTYLTKTNQHDKNP